MDYSIQSVFNMRICIKTVVSKGLEDILSIYKDKITERTKETKACVAIFKEFFDNPEVEALFEEACKGYFADPKNKIEIPADPEEEEFEDGPAEEEEVENEATED